MSDRDNNRESVGQVIFAGIFALFLIISFAIVSAMVKTKINFQQKIQSSDKQIVSIEENP